MHFQICQNPFTIGYNRSDAIAFGCSFIHKLPLIFYLPYYVYYFIEPCLSSIWWVKFGLVCTSEYLGDGVIHKCLIAMCLNSYCYIVTNRLTIYFPTPKYVSHHNLCPKRNS
jgi:hypothetical protein